MTCLTLILPESVCAEKVSIHFSSTKEGLARIILAWPSQVGFETSVEGRELLLQFKRPIEIPNISDLSRYIPSWIESVSTGFDTLLFRASKDVNFEVYASGNEIIVVLHATTPISAESQLVKEEAKGQLRLDLLRARLQADTGRENEALKLLERLIKEQPNNSHILSSLADVNRRIGLWRKANMLYNQALKIDPDNKNILLAKTSLWRDLVPRVKIESSRKDVSGTGSWEEWLTGISGHGFVADYTRLGVSCYQNFIKTDPVRRADGTTDSFDGTRYRGEIFIQHDAEGGALIKGSLFANSSTLGVGLLFSLWDISGRTSLFAEFKRPHWDYLEGLIENGTRDRLGIRREHKFGSRLSLQLGTAFERYGIPGDDNVATTQAVSGSVRYSIVKNQPLITAGYNLDADYRISIDSRTDSAGASYDPWPIVSREEHSFDTTISYSLYEDLIFDGYAGYSLDRLGAVGQFIGMNFTYMPLKDIEIQISYDRGLSAVSTSQTEDRIGGYFNWRF